MVAPGALGVLTARCERCRVGVTAGVPAVQRWVSGHVGVRPELLHPLEALRQGQVFHVEHPDHDVRVHHPAQGEAVREPHLPGLEPGLDLRDGH